VIRRKRRATEKFLKKDIADLLLNGLDINAYGRVIGSLLLCLFLFWAVSGLCNVSLLRMLVFIE